MGKKLTENEIEMLKNLMEEMKNEASAELTLQENMEISLASRVENIDEKKEVAELCMGIHDFDELLGQMEGGGGKELIVKTLDSSELGNKSQEEQYAALAEVLEACRKEVADNPDYGMEGLKEFAVKKDGEITPEDLEQLKNTVAEYLDEFSLLHARTESVEKLFETIGDEAAEELLKAYESEDTKYYMALAVYILQMQGKIDYISPEMGAREAGIGISAAVASAKAYLSGILGKIPWEKAMEILKKIASVTLTLLICAAVAAVAFKIGTFVFWMSAIVIGYGAVGAILAAVLAVGCGVSVADVLFDLVDSARETIEDAGNYAAEKGTLVKEWITETALPALKSFWYSLKDKITYYISELKRMGAKGEEESEESKAKEMAEEAEEEADAEETESEEEIDEEAVAEA